MKDYAAQYCAAKSLPFTAAEMTLDCVSVAFSTLVRSGVNQKWINALEAKGFKDAVCIIFKKKNHTGSTQINSIYHFTHRY